jgi:hypothetical protein
LEAITEFLPFFGRAFLRASCYFGCASGKIACASNDFPCASPKNRCASIESRDFGCVHQAVFHIVASQPLFRASIVLFQSDEQESQFVLHSFRVAQIALFCEANSARQKMKSHVVRARVEEDIFNHLEQEKIEKGYASISAILRAKLESEVRDEKVFSEFRSDILYYKNDMARIGNNLNQIAHSLHLFLPVEEARLMKELTTITKIMVHLNLSLSEALVRVDSTRR